MVNLTIGKWKQRTFDTFNEQLNYLTKNEPTMMLLGDSLFERIKFNQNNHNFLSQNNVFNAGIGGDRIENVIYRISDLKLFDYLDGSKLRKIILMIGTNNIENCKPIDMAEGFSKIIELIRYHVNSDCQINVIGILPRFTKNKKIDVIKLASEYNQLIKEICMINNLSYIDLSEKFFNNAGILDKKYFIDDVHLSDDGYNILFGTIQHLILE